MVRVGFTGTENGVSRMQRAAVCIALTELYEPGSEFHHGCCIGADDQMARVAKGLGYILIGHPPRIRKKVPEHPVVNDFDFPPEEYLVRDTVIARTTHLLLATPAELYEVVRSGTWTTVRRAVKFGKPGLVFRRNDGEPIPLSEAVGHRVR